MPSSPSDLDRFLTAVIAQHGRWKLHLHRASEGREVALDPATARRDDRCDLGRWIHGDARGVLPPELLSRIRDLHARFHVVAAEALAAGLGGRRQEARGALEHGSEFLTISATLVGLLDGQRASRRHGAAGIVPAEAAHELLGVTIEAGAQSELTLDAAATVAEHADALAAATEQQVASINEIAQRAAEAVSVMVSASERSDEAMRAMDELTAATGRVSEVLGLIDTIAKQTRLLALNATIEAARAGAAGRGFAVVAEEVKKLAGSVADATKEVGQIVDGVQANADAARSGITTFASAIDEVQGAQQSIAGAVEEQRQVSSDIAQRVGDVAGAVADIRDNAEFVSTATNGGVEAARGLERALAGREGAAA